jgi:HK97 family phage prohead protease/HK97 family phage major capsid protein
MGDIISSGGWDLVHFQKNPVALFNHRSDFPIGKWANLRAEGSALRGHLELAPEGTSPRIDEIRKLVEAGILRAVSVGFRPIEHEPIDKNNPFTGMRFLKQELVETSLVSVPANPNALSTAKSLKISPATIDLVFAEPGKKDTKIERRGLPGEFAISQRKHGKGEQMSSPLSQRITESEGRLNGLRDELIEHLKNIDDTNVSDADLDKTNTLNDRITQEEKTRTVLLASERNIAPTGTESAARSTTVVRSAGRPFTLPVKKTDSLDYVIRAGVVQAFAHHERISLEQARQAIARNFPYYDDEATKTFIDYVAKAATAPAITTVVGWAAELVQTIYADFQELLMPKSVFPRLSNLGLSLQFGRAGKVSIPTRSRTPTVAGSFVGEGQPIPVRQAAFTAQILTPKKMAVITSWTREMNDQSVPAIEGLLRNAIQEDTAVALDSVLLDANPATVVRPPGILNNVVPLTPTAGGGFAALVGDIKQLTGALLTATQGHIRSMTWLMNPQQVLSIGLTAAPGVGAFPFKDEISQGRLMSYPVIDSATVPMGTVIVLDAADFVTVGGEAPRFEISDQATLHYDDTTPLQISTVGSPNVVAAPVRSLWQTDSLALRLILQMNWALRRPTVATVSGVTW